MKTDQITPAELEAFRMYWGSSFGNGSTDQDFSDIHKAANKIIELAKTIKAQRKKNENLGNLAEKTQALLEALVEKTGKSEEELIWEGVQAVWHRYNF